MGDERPSVHASHGCNATNALGGWGLVVNGCTQGSHMLQHDAEILVDAALCHLRLVGDGATKIVDKNEQN